MLLKVKLINGRNFFNDKSNNFIKQCLLKIPTLHYKIFILADFGARNVGLKLEKLGKIVWLKIARNGNLIMQRGYCKQTLFNEIFLLIIEKISSVQ